MSNCEGRVFETVGDYARYLVGHSHGIFCFHQSNFLPIAICRLGVEDRSERAIAIRTIEAMNLTEVSTINKKFLEALAGGLKEMDE